MEKAQPKIALLGASGMLARKVREKALATGYIVTLYDLPDFDMTDRAKVLQELTRLQPDVIINCAAFTNVDGAETQQDLAMVVNGTAVGYLTEAALAVDAILVHVSTDYVFDGQKKSPYVEGDAPNPKSAYGRTKLAGEQAIIQSGLDKYFIVRTSWLYGPGGNNFVETILRLAAEREELRIIHDQVGSPTFTGDLADAIFSLLESVTSPQPPGPSLYGTYHFANEGSCSWYEFACEIVTLAKKQALPIKSQRLLPIRTEEYPLPAPRPAYSVFSKEKYLVATGAEIPGWKDSLVNYLKSRNNL
ncbi:MAG: dTDP-4-dehydrorhamnose reductase [Desulfuromonadales bacterium]|nr:dTDP-4-dehydrorhamnose reductase [Desulfuromonadales bacterium]